MAKIVGCGIDIEELNRFKKFIPTQSDIPELTKLVYSDEEISNNQQFLPDLTFPLGFSCKEAFFKAFGVSWTNSPITWKEIELILTGPLLPRLNHSVKPDWEFHVRLSGHALELFKKMNCTRFETAIEVYDDHTIFQVLLYAD